MLCQCTVFDGVSSATTGFMNYRKRNFGGIRTSDSVPHRKIRRYS